MCNWLHSSKHDIIYNHTKKRWHSSQDLTTNYNSTCLCTKSLGVREKGWHSTGRVTWWLRWSWGGSCQRHCWGDLGPPERGGPGRRDREERCAAHIPSVWKKRRKTCWRMGIYLACSTQWHLSALIFWESPNFPPSLPVIQINKDTLPEGHISKVTSWQKEYTFPPLKEETIQKRPCNWS